MIRIYYTMSEVIPTGWTVIIRWEKYTGTYKFNALKEGTMRKVVEACARSYFLQKGPVLFSNDEDEFEMVYAAVGLPPIDGFDVFAHCIQRVLKELPEDG